MRLRDTTLTLVSLAVLSGAMAVGFAQLTSDSDDVQVTFQNTSLSPLTLSLIDENGKEMVHVPSLAAGSQVSVNSRPGNVWTAKLGGQEFAEYTVDGSQEQEVDLALEGTWKLPVEVVLQNNTDDAVSLWLIKEENQPVELCGQLDPGQQWEQPGLATGSFLQVKRDNEVVAEYLTDNVPSQVLPLSELLEAYSQSVSVSFQNTTTEPVDIYWLHPDGGARLIHSQLPREHQVVQGCFAGHRWLIVQDGELIGNFIAGNDSEQTVDLGELAEQTLVAYTAIAEGRSVPDDSEANLEPPSNDAKPVVDPGNPTEPINKVAKNAPPKRRRPAVPPANVGASDDSSNVPNTPEGTGPAPSNASSKPPAIPERAAPRFTLDSIVGRYKKMPVENGWHDVIITKAEGRQGVFVWQNRAGESWWLYGNGNNPVLTTDETNPYFDDGEAHRQVRVEFVPDSSGNLTHKIKGLKFLRDEIYLKVSDSTNPDD